MTRESQENRPEDGTINEGYESEEENPLDSISKTVHLIKLAAETNKPYRVTQPGYLRYFSQNKPIWLTASGK